MSEGKGGIIILATFSKELPKAQIRKFGGKIRPGIILPACTAKSVDNILQIEKTSKGDGKRQEKTDQFFINWNQVLEYFDLEGKVIECNQKLCLRCFSLNTVEAVTHVHFCLDCGFKWGNLE